MMRALAAARLEGWLLGIDYIIDGQTVRDLAAATNDTTLVWLNDREKMPATREIIEHAIAEGPVFDQLDV